MKYSTILKAALFSLVVLLTVAELPAQQGEINPGIPALPGSDTVDINTLRAREEFRIGVQAYHRYSFNEAILSFERALAFRPGEPIILDWLARSYFSSGIESAAFRMWQSAAEGYGLSSGIGMLIASRLHTLQNHRVLLPVPNDTVRYVESGRFPGTNNDVSLYRHPSAFLPLKDGSVWVVAYGSNEIIRIGVNGLITDRRRGPFTGFDRPYDLVQGQDGNLFLSEFRGNRVSVLSPEGNWLFHIGSRGQGAGQFVGPKNLTIDDEGYLYVVDYGNRRIAKFDPEGTFILSFGTRGSSFQGFLSPTGIVARSGRIYVSDSLHRQIFMFDTNGAYLGILRTEGLLAPESLRLLSDGRILSADANRVILIDPDTAIIRELGVIGNRDRVQLSGAEMDANGNVLAADFNAGEVAIMTRIDDMAAGLFVAIRRIIADNFPQITVEVEVTDRLRRPVLGLEENNFLLVENGIPVTDQSLLSAAHRSADTAMSILIERSPATQSQEDDIAAALREITASTGNVVSIVSAGDLPVRETSQAATPAQRLLQAARGTPGAHSSGWRFDLALRLAASDLLDAEKKRSLVFVGAGVIPSRSSGVGDVASLGEMAFEQYSLSELAAYLSNNNIVFHAIIVGSGVPGADILYLTERTGGSALALYRNEGIAPELRKLIDKPSGIYTLRFRSRLPTDFGRAYLPLEAEVYLMNRSGRDSSGYFPPLE